MPRTRVGVVAPCWINGGAETHTLTLLKALDPARFAVQGVAVKGGPFDRPLADRSPWPISDAPDAVGHLLRQSDLLISWKFANLKVRLEGTSHRPKVIYVNHSVEPWTDEQAATVRPVDHIVAVSELALEPIPAVLKSKASVIWNAVDPERLKPKRSREEMRTLWGIPHDARVAGFLGRACDEKDPLAMVRLAGALPQPWRVAVVGDGPLRSKLGGWPGEGYPRLHALGADPAAADCLNAFDVLVVPSKRESFGLAFGEGLLMGKPVVSTDVGLAKLWPGCSTRIPFDCDGPTLAAAVVGAFLSGPIGPGALMDRLRPARFTAEWTALIDRIAAPGPARTSIDPAVRDKINSCDYRGSVLPISMQAECGCRGQELTECGRGRGKVAGRVTLRDCLACQAG